MIAKTATMCAGCFVVLCCVVLQVVFVSSCSSLWDCGSVALDDISLSQGDCELTEGRKHKPAAD